MACIFVYCRIQTRLASVAISVEEGFFFLCDLSFPNFTTLLPGRVELLHLKRIQPPVLVPFPFSFVLTFLPDFFVFYTF